MAVGLFFGESAAVLKWAADGFVKLLQMTVLPYVTVSIVTSLGSLNYQQARTLGIRAGAVLGGLWMVALLYAFLIPLAFPGGDSAMFFSSALLERRPAFNFVDLYIPSNPFNSLANNVVPAVVLFSVIVGVALIGVERKQRLLDVLQTASEALSRATRFIVRLTPYGLFAIAATAAGTLSIEQLGRLQVYLISYVGVALLLSLWVLPGLVATLTPVGAREMFSLTRNALITACVAGDLFIVLPALVEASRTLIARHAPHLPEASELPDVLVPASFNFPHTGKLLSISFILFAGWFADAAVPVDSYPQLAVTGLLTFFGSLNAAVPFLLDLFRIPADTFQLFLATGVINSRVGTLVAAVHTLTVAILGTCAITGMLRFQRARVLRYLAITAGLTVLVLGGARLLFDGYLRADYSKGEVLGRMHLLRAASPATVHRVPLAQTAETGPLLETMRARGVLRVGYLADALPYAFFNATGDLVGLDIDLAHRLASELGVRLEFMPVERDRLTEELSRNCCDIVMGGVAVTTLRASQVLFSATYLDETLAFVVPDHSRELFSSWDEIRGLAPLVIAVPNVPYYIDKLREKAPRAELRVLQDGVSRAFTAWPADVSALAMPAERGSAWTLLHPEYSVVVPEPGILKLPLAYPIGRHDAAFASFINTWIDLKRKDGTIASLYDYWVQGRDASPRQPRWSIIRDVLHWTK